MFIGIPKEIKDHEYRVGASPAMVQALVKDGHEVCVQTNAGASIGLTDEVFKSAGAKIVDSAKEVYEAEMIIKVKEPQRSEISLLKEGQILFCYLHLASEPELVKGLLERKVVSIAYETITDSVGGLPLLVPMSEIAGRASIIAGSSALQMANKGRGVLLGGVTGVLPANVVIIGGGIVGTEAARMAMGLGASVTILDCSLNRLRELDNMYAPRLKTLYSTPYSIAEAVAGADLIIGAVLLAGKKAPCLVTREMLSTMHKGAAIVDVAIDQGGCVETARVTSHSDPFYVVEDVVHYCVPNIPGIYARTSTQALTNATMSSALKIAKFGYREALLEDEYLCDGLNTYYGKITHPSVAEDLGCEYHSPLDVLESDCSVKSPNKCSSCAAC